MKHLVCIAILSFALACKTTSEGETTATPTEPETAAQEPAVDPPTEDPEPTSQPAEDPSEDHPVTKCCDGLEFDEVAAFPFSFTVSKKDAAVGKITLDAKHVATFEPAEGANAEYAAEIKSLVETANTEGKVSYTYSNRTKETHCKCGGEAQKGAAQYPGAFKHSLYSEYFDVSD